MNTKPYTRVRAKFYVTGITESSGYRTYNLQPVYSPDKETENGKFWEASPNGKAQFSSKIGEAVPWPEFELGKKYYFDFTYLSDDPEPPAGSWFIKSLSKTAAGAHKDYRGKVGQVNVSFTCLGYSGHIDILILNKDVFDQYELAEFQTVTITDAPDQ